MFGRRVTTNEPLRPALIASLLLSAYILSSGATPGRLPAPAWMKRVRVDDRLSAGLLAAVALILALAYSTTTAGGADAYGYVSQADLWIDGRLKIQQPWVAHVPFPNAKWVFSPLGYRPVESPGELAIVPTYSPGLPLLMAGAKLIAGHCAMFWVVPLSGALLVLTTFGLGRRLGSSRAGLIAAWLVATSPAFLFMVVWPMTDVPVAAAWAVAFYFLLGERRWHTMAAGGAAAVAILIRPNLAPAAALMACWYAWRAFRSWDSPGRLTAIVGAGAFVGVASIGAIATGAINASLYGSPLTSGYLGLAGMYDAANVWPNLQRYSSWVVLSETGLPFIGLAAIVVPLRRIWPAVRDRVVLSVIALFVLTLWSQYLFYIVFEEWWYLRFLLPAAPFMMLGLTATALALTSARRHWRTVVILLLVAVGVRNMMFAVDRGVFGLWQGERRYAAIGRLVRTHTEPGSAVLSMQHSGSLRYYSGRVTMRYDNMDQDWLDRTIDWLTEQNVPVYLVAEDWEVPQFKTHFASQDASDRLKTPVLTYKGSGTILLYDLRRDRKPVNGQIYLETYEDSRCVPPAPSSSMGLRLMPPAR